MRGDGDALSDGGDALICGRHALSGGGDHFSGRRHALSSGGEFYRLEFSGYQK